MVCCRNSDPIGCLAVRARLGRRYWLLYAYGAAHATAPHANRHPIRLTTQAIHSVQRAVRPCNRKCVCASRVFLMGVLVYRRLSSGSYFLIISAGASPAVRRASRRGRRAAPCDGSLGLARRGAYSSSRL